MLPRSLSPMADALRRVAGKMTLPVLILTGFALGEAVAGKPATHDTAPALGPLRVHPSNPRYFTADGNRAVYLTGSHTWRNLQDRGTGNPPPPFDYGSYLDMMRERNHNFMRMWTWESAYRTAGTTADVHTAPLQYAQTGTAAALNDEPRFDLTVLNPDYFSRLRRRVLAARDRGIYVSVMLFQGWSIQKKPGSPGNPWPSHPFQRDNNVNGIDADSNGDGDGGEVHTLENPRVVAIHEAYIRKVIETVSDLDNVLYEITNEDTATPTNTAWQYHMIKYIRELETRLGRTHPILMTVQWPGPGNRNHALFASPADAISPGWGGHWKSAADDYKHNPPPADGRKVILADTDHLWGLGGDAAWVWKAFTRGLHPIYMDSFHEDPLPGTSYPPADESARRAMGHTLRYARKLNLAAMRPEPRIASSHFVLANIGHEYIVYVPSGNHTVTLQLPRSVVRFEGEWFNPRSAETVALHAGSGAGPRQFTSPFPGDAVLYIAVR